MNENKPSALSVKELSVFYRHQPALWGVNLEIPEGVLAGVIGPNGAGKSTLLKAALGLLPLSSGSVEVLGKPLREALSLIAYVPQKDEIEWDFPVCVADVVLMGRYGRHRFFQRPTKRDREIASEALEKVGMSDFSDRQISELSGGQQQRVFLARALCQQAQVYILDEPFAGVDVLSEERIMEVLRGLRAEGRTVICVHHDLNTVESYFDFLALLNIRLIAAGPVEEVYQTELIRKAYGANPALLFEVARGAGEEEKIF